MSKTTDGTHTHNKLLSTFTPTKSCLQSAGDKHKGLESHHCTYLKTMTYLWAHPSCMPHLHFSAPFLWTFFTSHTGQLQPCKDSDQSYIIKTLKRKTPQVHKIQVSKRPLTSQKCAFFVNILSTRRVKHCLMPIFQWNRLSCRLRSSLQTSRLLICVVSQVRKLRHLRQVR